MDSLHRDPGGKLRSAFASAQPLEQFIGRMTADQRSLHEFHARRALIDRRALMLLRTTDVEAALVITEPWCTDSLAILPIVGRLLGEADCDVRVIGRDEPPHLIERYLTRGGRAVPIVILLDSSGVELAHWGPRPEPAQSIFEEHRQALADGTVSRRVVTRALRAFYSRDRGRTIVEELTSRLEPSRPPG